MKKIKTLLLLTSLLSLLVITSSYKSEVSARGGEARGGNFHGGDFHNNAGERNDYGRDGNYGGYGTHGGYGGYGGYAAPAVYPAYGYPYGGGNLYPGPVNPGEDEANAIFRANEHQPQ